MTTTNDGCTWEPWSDGHAVGFKVTDLTSGEIEYVYLNPSTESDDKVPNVFLYHGPNGDPSKDGTVIYVDLFNSRVRQDNARRLGNPSLSRPGHDVTIEDPPSVLDGYWWACSCGDAGGPFEAYELAWNSVVTHVNRTYWEAAKARLKEMVSKCRPAIVMLDEAEPPYPRSGE